MKVQCPKCSFGFQVSSDSTNELLDTQLRSLVKDEQVRSATNAEVARVRGLREVAREAQKTCNELSKARKCAHREQSRMQELNIDPNVITLVQTMISRLTEFEVALSYQHTWNRNVGLRPLFPLQCFDLVSSPHA